MTRSFLIRSAVAAVPLTLGLVFTLGQNSMYDRMISTLSVFEIGVVMSALVSLFVGIGLWVLLALKPSRWAQHAVSRGKPAAVIAVISAACLAGQPAQAVSMVVAGPSVMITTNSNYCVCDKKTEPVKSVEIDQPFTLSPEVQAQVDAAVVTTSKDAKDNPGFVVSTELAIGIFIAAVVIGVVLVIIVRLVCSSLDRMRESLNSRLSRLKNFLSNPGTNQTQPVILGAALFNHRTATTNDLPTGKELAVGFNASSEPPLLSATVKRGETVSLAEFIGDFGLTSKMPLDSSVGQGVDRVDGGYRVAPADFTNLVTLVIESTTNLIQESWRQAVKITVPEGAILDFADLTGNSEGRFWRVGVTQ